LLEISGRSKPYMLFLCTVYTLICACITYVSLFLLLPHSSPPFSSSLQWWGLNSALTNAR
jgi:hypothetical protein